METRYKIKVIVESKTACPNESELKKVAEKTLELEEINNYVELNILLTDNNEIKKLNSRFLRRNGPTDVIAFGAKKGRPLKHNLKGFIGDIVISVEMAEYNAKRFNTTRKEEICLYIIHGILHLLGYGDESDREKRIMENRQECILKSLATGYEDKGMARDDFSN